MKDGPREREIDHWNYRMFQQRVPDGVGGYVEQFTIREAYYDSTDTRPHSWTVDECAPYGETKMELIDNVYAMAAAASAAVLVLSEDGSEIVAEQRPTARGKRRG